MTISLTINKQAMEINDKTMKFMTLSMIPSQGGSGGSLGESLRGEEPGVAPARSHRRKTTPFRLKPPPLGR